MKQKFLLLIAALACAWIPAAAQEVYCPNPKGDISPMTKAVVTGNKTSGKALLAAYGAKLTSSLVIDGKRSNTILPANSAALYLFIPKNIPLQGWKLTKLKQKKKERELPYMKTGAYSGSKSNMEELPIMTMKFTEELYMLKPASSLSKGEYALVYIENGVPALIYDFSVEESLPPYPEVSRDVLMAEFYSSDSRSEEPVASVEQPKSTNILRWFFDSDPRGARVFYRVISNVPNEVKNTNESYMTTTPLEETKSLNIPGLTYKNSSDVVIEIKVTKRGYEEQIKRYNVRQALDQQEISGFFELVEKTR